MKILSNWYLYDKYNVRVGECCVFSESHVAYHLWKDLRSTKYLTLKQISAKFELRRE